MRSGALRARGLLEVEHDEFRRLQRGESDDDVDDAAVDVGLRGRRRAAVHEVGVCGRPALEVSWRNRSAMKVPMLRRREAQSGSSFGSKTAHWVLRYRLS